MGRGDREPKASQVTGRRRRLTRLVVRLAMGLVRVFVPGLLLAVAAYFIAQWLEGPSLEQQLRRFINAENGAGRVVVAEKRVELAGPGLWSRVLVLRDRRGHRSDRLVVLDERSGDLTTAFEFEPQPLPPRRPRRPGVHGSPRRYTLRFEGQADMTGSGNPELLFSIDGARWWRLPVALTHDTAEGPRLTPLLPRNVVVGPRTPLSREDAMFLAAHYPGPPERVGAAAGRTRIEEARGDAFGLIKPPDGRFLAVGFLVGTGGQSPELDVDCEVGNTLRGGLDPPCGGAASGRAPVPKWVNMKAWRFDQQGGRLTTTFCSGDRMIVRVRGEGDRAALRRTWRRYIARPRLC